jgi:hypothetical protein
MTLKVLSKVTSTRRTTCWPVARRGCQEKVSRSATWDGHISVITDDRIRPQQFGNKSVRPAG